MIKLVVELNSNDNFRQAIATITLAFNVIKFDYASFNVIPD